MERRMSNARVRAACLGDKPAIVNALTTAFDRDDAFNYTLRQDARREQAQQLAWRTLFDRFFPFGMTYVVNDDEGASLWCKHDQLERPLFRELLLLPSYVRWCGLARVARGARAFERMLAAHPRDPHLYLFAIGITPAAQGHGLGASLLGHTLQICDFERTPAYLEATSPQNKALYLRHGFEVTREFAMGDDGPLLTGMWREPSTRISP
jgi:GNAT superfamily N-acetyltransferase